MIEFNENGTWEKSTGKVKPIIYIVWEKVSDGDYYDLCDFLAVEEDALPENICRFYFKQMLSAMHAVHSAGITHRDVRPGTFDVDKHFNLRLTNFGFAAPVGGRDGSGLL